MDNVRLVLPLAAFATAVLSATLGMAGGLILMGVYTALLPVPEAMVLHGFTQLIANGGRAVLLRSHVQWRGVVVYVAGALVAWAGLRMVAFVPPQSLVYLGIGAMPFVARVLPASPLTDFSHRRAAALCGALVMGAQMLFGVAGPLLDLFFLRTTLTRREVVATKATTQTAAHLLKIAYFLPLLTGGTLPARLVVGVMAGALVGTWAGGRLLERMSEGGFRAATRNVVLVVGAFYLWKGIGLTATWASLGG